MSEFKLVKKSRNKGIPYANETYVKISLQGSAGLALFVACILAAVLVVAVAVVIACAVLRPGSEAYPAEFVFTLFASHVVASEQGEMIRSVLGDP